MKITELNAWLTFIRKIQLIQNSAEKQTKKTTKKKTNFTIKGF